MNQYPLWRYILLIVLIVLGVIYALPNLYGENYAIQVSTKNGTAVTAATATRISTALKQQKISYLSIEKENVSYLIRFKKQEEQSKAQSVIQAILGEHYTVALNLAPRTPEWLQSIGAKPMRLGLDLRGGIHFLLAVDVDKMLTGVQTADYHSMSQRMRDAEIRYANIAQHGRQGIVIGFRDAKARDKAQTLLQKNFRNYTFTASQAGDHYLLTALMLKPAVLKLEETAVSQNLNVIRSRVNELGVAEPVIRQQGKSQISVNLPGIQDTARAKNIIGKMALLHFQLEDTQHDAQTAARTGVVPFGSTLYTFQGRPVLIKNQVVLSGSSVVSASTITGDDGRPAVAIRASGSEVASFNKITAQNIGKPMATILIQIKSVKQIVNGKVVIKTVQTPKVISIATIQSALGGNFTINGLDSLFAAKNLALQLRSGAYTAPVAFVQEQVVGPAVGQENIDKGVLSCEVGSLLVILFMLAYYRFFGFVADLALLLNVIFIVAIMSLIGATMTLPGIAAIVLTVGMAVDANVLIDERIREELRLGMSPQAAIYAGYARAFTTIVDANVTTLIVAIVLFALGTGSVQGFAVTLVIGLLTSMVTAIFFTRAIINLTYGNRPVKHLSIGIKVKEVKK